MNNSKKWLLFFLLLSLANSNLLTAQTTTPYGATTDIHSLSSDIGRTYQIFVTLPAGYSEKEAYPVVYYLDAWWLSEIVRGAYALLHLSGKVEPLILVGISSTGGKGDWHRQRNYDYTPSPYQKPESGIVFQAGTVPMDATNTGGGQQFTTFLKEQLFLFVEGQYAVDTGNRGLIGHSFGGLFGMFVLGNSPSLFDHYLLISPSLWWNQSELLKDFDLESLRQTDSPNHLFLAIGEYEFGLIKRPAQEVDARIQAAQIPESRYRYWSYPYANHNSVVPRAVYDGLEWLYGE